MGLTGPLEHTGIGSTPCVRRPIRVTESRVVQTPVQRRNGLSWQLADLWRLLNSRCTKSDRRWCSWTSAEANLSDCRDWDDPRLLGLASSPQLNPGESRVREDD